MMIEVEGTGRRNGVCMYKKAPNGRDGTLMREDKGEGEEGGAPAGTQIKK